LIALSVGDTEIEVLLPGPDGSSSALLPHAETSETIAMRAALPTTAVRIRPLKALQAVIPKMGEFLGNP
jgi:hypothetical protein